MKVVQVAKKNKLLVFVILAYVILGIVMPQKAMESEQNSMYYVKEMLQIMPVIFILTSLIEAWVPREIIIKGFGEESGYKGSILSFILGSISAGPIYAAFPISKMLLSKGASISNIVIILSSWAVVKIPMLANEAKFLGPRFMVTRWVLTTVAIFMMACIVSKIVKKKDIPMEKEKSHGITLSIKEQYCIGCAICVKMDPDNFELDNGKAKMVKQVLRDKSDKEKNNKANGVIAKCPTKAIDWK